jgi:hypothetical protein
MTLIMKKMAPNSLINSLDVNFTVDDIISSLNSPMGQRCFYIMLEGQDDCMVYPKFFDGEEKTIVEYVYGDGKGRVLRALELLKGKTKRVLGICDADFRHLEQDYPAMPNLFFTDCHDIEMTMLKDNKTLINAFTEYLVQDKAKEILQTAIDALIFAGYTRWYNDKNKTGLKFKKLSIASYYKTKIFDSSSFLDKLNERSPNEKACISVDDINDFETINKTTDYFNLCNGHDVVSLIVAIIQTYPHNKTISKEGFCSVLRASFTLDSFKKTKLYATISKWQEKNGYNILLEKER